MKVQHSSDRMGVKYYFPNEIFGNISQQGNLTYRYAIVVWNATK